MEEEKEEDKRMEEEKEEDKRMEEENEEESQEEEFSNIPFFHLTESIFNRYKFV